MKVRKDSIVEDFHGVLVADPYRWMENPEDPELKTFIELENTRTEEFLAQCEKKEELAKRQSQLLDYPRYELAKRVDTTYYYKLNPGLKNQPLLYRVEGSNEAELLLDPNTLSEDGTVALYTVAVNANQTVLAYSLSASGSDKQSIHMLNLQTKEHYPEVILHCKFTSIQFLGTDSFFYTRYPTPGTVEKEDESNFCQVYLHRLGTAQSADELIYERKDAKELSFYGLVTEDERYLLLHVVKGTDPRNRVYYKDLTTQGEVQRLIDEEEATYSFLGNEGATFYFHTTYQADQGRIVAISLDSPDKASYCELVPEKEHPISHASLVGNRFVIAYSVKACHHLEVYHLDGRFDHEISLPSLGTVLSIEGTKDREELLFSYASFLEPTTIFRYLLHEKKLSVLFSSSLNFDPSLFVATQQTYSSLDGTPVTMFVLHKKDCNIKSGENPTILYGYGGFGISMTPSFSPSIIQWMEEGGVYAIANLRGGNEYGEKWHEEGMLSKKQNVFDDFASAAKWLISEGYTKAEKLGIMGGSNGGLLVAASMVQNPKLFGAVVCRVPVTDMLRFHKFTVGRYWIPEYGSAEDKEQFEVLYAYSPLHNVKEDSYPSTLMVTADTDDRVVPAHAFKFGATLKEHQKGPHPILFRVDTKAGHGHGKPVSKIIAEQRDITAFFLLTLNP